MIYKELVLSAHRFIEFECPVSDDELVLRESEYEILSPKKFNTKRTKEAFSPFRFSYQGKVHELKIDYGVIVRGLKMTECPFCKSQEVERKEECFFCDGEGCSASDYTKEVTVVSCTNPQCVNHPDSEVSFE